MEDLMTDSFVGAAAQAQQDAGSTATAGGDEKLQLFLQEAEAAKNEMSALRDELARLRFAHEASKSLLNPGKPLAAIHATLLHLLRSARRLRTRLESMDRRAPASSSAAAGLRAGLHNVTAGVQGLRRQVSAECRADLARCYLTVTGELLTEEQVDLLAPGGSDAETLMRRAIADEMDGRHEAAGEVESDLLELQLLFLDMAMLVGLQGERVGDIEQHVVATAGDVAAARQELQEARRLQSRSRRRRLCVVGLVAFLLLVVLAVVAAVVAVELARKNGKLTLATDLAFL